MPLISFILRKLRERKIEKLAKVVNKKLDGSMLSIQKEKNGYKLGFNSACCHAPRRTIKENGYIKEICIKCDSVCVAIKA